MKKHMRKFESIFWLFIRLTLYTSLFLTFTTVMGLGNIGLNNLSRTLGVTLITFVSVGAMFIMIYGKFDVGRRKSKPIVRSLSLAVLCTDLITYIQTMIMQTNTPSIRDFRLDDIELLLLVYVIQVLLIIAIVYFGNWLFFKFHKPEKCYVITSSQDSLNSLMRALTKYKKQYVVTKVLDYNDPELFEKIKHSEAVFIYDIPSKERLEILRACYSYRKNVYFNPEVEDIMEFCSTHYLLDDLCLFNKNVKAMTMQQRISKRLIDLFFSIVGLIIGSPILLLSAIAIKIEDGGPVFFKQERATINGRIFNVYKLRTMKTDAAIKSATKDDDRITKVGKILRKSRMDELPQLINVFNGEMSLVGPRPEMMSNVQNYTEELPEFEYRLRMKAGLTGYAQIAGKYNTTPKDKLIMDMMYIEQFSILRDIQLIMQTVIVLLKFDSTEGFDDENSRDSIIFEKHDENNTSIATDK